MGTRVDIRRAVDLAQSLGEFTRNEFAAELGVSPLEAGKWLRRLQDEKDTIRREGAKYVFDDPEQREVEHPPYEGVDVRIVARKLHRFTARDLIEATGLVEGTAHAKIKWLVEHGVIRDSGKRGWREGRRPVIYEAIEVKAESTPRPKRKAVEVEMHEKRMLDQDRNGHVKRIKHQYGGDWQRIIDTAIDAGCEVSKGGKHFKIKFPSGVSMSVAATPGSGKSGSAKKTLAQARRLGLNV